MSKTRNIAVAVGRAKLASELGVGLTAVSNAVVANRFPAAWYVVVKSLCDSAGIDCPPEIFGMKSTVSGKLGAEPQQIQGAASR